MNRRRTSSGTSVSDTESWQARAVCATHGDPDWWMSETRTEKDQARAYCHACPVQAACLTEHIDEPAGIWGGLGPEQRRALRNRGPDPEVIDPADGIPHGSRTGYQRCAKRPAGACAGCKSANREYVAARRNPAA